MSYIKLDESSMLPNLTVIVVYGLYIINNNKVSVYSLSFFLLFILDWNGLKYLLSTVVNNCTNKTVFLFFWRINDRSRIIYILKIEFVLDN